MVRFLRRVKWTFGKGNLLIIGQDRIVSIPKSYTISNEMIEALHKRGIIFLDQVIKCSNGVHPTWKKATHLRLTGHKSVDWNNYVTTLKILIPCTNDNGDSLSWDEPIQKGVVVVADNYKHLMNLTKDTNTSSQFIPPASLLLAKLQMHIFLRNSLFV